MQVALLVPLATEDPHRLAAWDWIRARYQTEQPEWGIVTGDCPDDWCKAVAVADALTQTDATIVVVADSDVWCPQLPKYVRRVADGTAEWATPHRRVLRYNEEATARILDGVTVPTERPDRRMLAEAEYDAWLGGGLVVVTRDLYQRCPLDPRFVGWGGEDIAWAYALCTLSPRRRAAHGNHPLHHLWHPSQPRLTRAVGSEANEQLKERYRQAAGDRDVMLALIEEGRCHSRTSSPAPSQS